MADELTTTVATTTTDLAHANLARYAKDAQGAFAPNTALVHFDDLRDGRMLFLLWFEPPDAKQAQ